MKNLFVVLMTLLSLTCHAQIKFEKGYFIRNNGEVTNCLIKNVDWKNNPTRFEYKINEETQLKIASIDSVQEFGILNTSKYQRFAVKIDRSSRRLTDLSTNKNPEFIEEILFLKILVEGEASLYLYDGGEVQRFFYIVDGSPIKQLIYKRYLAPDKKVGENNSYKQQLWNDLRCDGFLIKDAENTDYRDKGLINYFTKYNSCKNSKFKIFDEPHKRDLFNLTIRPGLRSSSLSIQNDVARSLNTDFGRRLVFTAGIETEFILPFNKNKWALIVEPTYQYFEAEEKTSSTRRADYTSIELPVGLRHYFFLNDNSKLFFNVCYVFDFDFSSKISFESGSELDISTRNSIALGIGYNYRRNYSVELRYGFDRDVLGNYLYWTSNYKTVSVMFGYRIF